MSDRLHDHETLGFRRGCVACAQVEADLAVSRNKRRQAQGQTTPMIHRGSPREHVRAG